MGKKFYLILKNIKGLDLKTIKSELSDNEGF